MATHVLFIYRGVEQREVAGVHGLYVSILREGTFVVSCSNRHPTRDEGYPPCNRIPRFINQDLPLPATGLNGYPLHPLHPLHPSYRTFVSFELSFVCLSW